MKNSVRQQSVRRREVLKALSLLPAAWLSIGSHSELVFSCSPSNDVYKVVTAGGRSFPRHESPKEAVAKAPRDSGVLILADGYPEHTTPLSPDIFANAADKKLRLYVEFPSYVPGLAIGQPQGIAKGKGGNLLERVVVASDAFGQSAERLTILDCHDARYVPVEFPNADLVLARVAGFDRAVYGLPPDGVRPILFKTPQGNVLVATSKLSEFITGRYAPTWSWALLWNWVLDWLQLGSYLRQWDWKSSVNPSFSPNQTLPQDAELQAFQRGVEWYKKSKVIVDVSWKQTVLEREALGHPSPAPPAGWPVGNGTEGVLEGFSNTIEYDGSQLLGWGRRNDCAGESSFAMACSSVISGNTRDGEIAANLNDFIYTLSALAQGPRNDPASPSYGLVGWGLPNSTGTYYADDNARSLLGTIGTAALLKSDRWDEFVLRCLLANLRTTGKFGFRGRSLEEAKLQANGWRYYYDADTIHYAPHYEAFPWACYLWAYDKTRDARFLDRTKNAIRMTMAAYPDQWKWTNGIQQERARLLLPLAWLVRVENTAEHRQWLRHMAGELLSFQVECGALREEVGAAGQSHYGPPTSNDRYGTNEASLLQENGDPACDLLYTSNFAFLGLHEAAAATGDAYYAQAASKLAEFLCRIQARSTAHPELDGVWFRAFDYKIWDYWASNSDAGWGVWSTETGWTQAWITSVLAMRRMKTSLWELTAKSQVAKYMDKLLPVMMPGT